jgi:hypothetical protein
MCSKNAAADMLEHIIYVDISVVNTRWFKYDQDYLCVNKSQFVPVMFEPPCINYIQETSKIPLVTSIHTMDFFR